MLTRTAAVAAIWRYDDMEVYGPAVVDGLTVSRELTAERMLYTVSNADGERLIIRTRELMYHAVNGWRIRCRLLPEVPA